MATHQQAEDRVTAGFFIHLAVYFAVVGGLAIMNYQRNPDNLWVLWVAGGWGIGIVAHAVAFFANREHLVNRMEARLDQREARQGVREDRREARQERREERYEARHDATNMTDKMSDASQRPPTV